MMIVMMTMMMMMMMMMLFNMYLYRRPRRDGSCNLGGSDVSKGVPEDVWSSAGASTSHCVESAGRRARVPQGSLSVLERGQGHLLRPYGK